MSGIGSTSERQYTNTHHGSTSNDAGWAAEDIESTDLDTLFDSLDLTDPAVQEQLDGLFERFGVGSILGDDEDGNGISGFSYPAPGDDDDEKIEKRNQLHDIISLLPPAIQNAIIQKFA